MRRFRPPLWLVCATGIGLALPAHAAPASEGLQPFQLVRSLQLVQDRIAGGDHAALPMQAKLLELTDARLRQAGTDAYSEPRNFRALLVYGMSGGNPATLQEAIARLKLDKADRALADAVISYLEGDPAAALKAFDSIEMNALSDDIVTFVCLVKGSLLAREQPDTALELLDRARLLAPGTLVEEAALRRSIAIAVSMSDAERFTRASTQYVARFLHSPYASQFADSFVTGAVAFDAVIGRDKLDEIVSMMDAERRHVIWLRIARGAAIEGLAQLSAFSAAKAKSGKGEAGGTDARTQLYSGLSKVADEPVEDLAKKLRGIDRNQLSPGDRMLLDAVRTVTSEVIAPPAGVFASPPAKAVKQNPATPTPHAITAQDEAELPLVEGIMPEPASARATPAPAPSEAASPAIALDAQPPAKPDQTDEAISRTRRAIGKIDQLLGTAPL